MKRHFNSTNPLQNLVPASTATGLISYTPARMEPACRVHCQETKLSHCILPDIHIMSDTALQSAEQSSSHLLTPCDDKSTQLGFTTNVYVIQLYVHIVYQPWWCVSWEIQRKIQSVFIPINVALTHLCPSILLHLVIIHLILPLLSFLRPISFVFWGLWNSFFFSNHDRAFFPHPHSLSLSAFSFIHILLL